MRPLSTFLARLIWLNLLPLLLVATWLGFDKIRTRDAGTRQEATNTAKNFAVAIDQHLKARVAALTMLAMSPLADDPKRMPELYTEAQGFLESFGSHVILADTGESMRMRFNTRAPLTDQLPFLPQPKGNAAAPTALKTARPAIGDLFMGPIAKEPLIAIAVPGIRDGEVKHLLLTIIAARQFQQRIEQVALPVNWSLTLVDGLGDVIARNAPADFVEQREHGERNRFVAHSTMSSWSVILEIPDSVFNEATGSTALVLALAIAAATIAGLLSSTLSSRRLVRQLVTMASQVPTDSEPIDIVEIAKVRQMLKEYAANLRLSESRFEATFEQAAMGIALAATDGRLLRVNTRFCQITGYNRDELADLAIWELIHPDDRAGDAEARRHLRESDAHHCSMEERFLRKDRKTIWINLGLTLIRAQGSGDQDYYISVVEDIQARKNAEQALIVSEQRYRTLVENANSAIIHWDHDGAITFFNTFAQQLFGWSKEEIIGRHIQILLPEQDSTGNDLSGLVEDIVAHPERYRHNINENIRKDGSRIWVMWTNRVLCDDQDRATGILTVGNDITDLKRAEILLRQQEERIRFALDTSQMGAWDWDPADRNVYRTLRHDQIFGYETLLPRWTYRMFLDHVSPEYRDEVDARFRHAVETGNDLSLECRIQRNDGQMRWIWVAMRRTGGEYGIPRRFAGIIQDITERKRAEEELLRRNEELEQFNLASVERELRMIELKRQINELSQLLGKPAPFDLSFTEIL